MTVFSPANADLVAVNSAVPRLVRGKSGRSVAAVIVGYVSFLTGRSPVIYEDAVSVMRLWLPRYGAAAEEATSSGGSLSEQGKTLLDLTRIFDLAQS